MEEQQHSLESPLAYLSQTVVGSRWWAWCQRAWYGAAPRGQAGLGTQIKGRQGWVPLCLWSRVRVCVCVVWVCMCMCVEARPTHTAQRPSSDTHTHTSLSFQNTQHFHKTAKQKKKVPHKTLWTSVIKTAIKSPFSIPIQFTDLPIVSPYQTNNSSACGERRLLFFFGPWGQCFKKFLLKSET